MAFAPDYATSRRFYVYYTTNGGDIRIEEYKRSASNADAADPSSARPLLTIEHSTFPNHNGGQLQFGPDGFLYAGTGDGGAAGDPFRNGQNTGTLLGKLLRIDPRKGSPYAVPAGNPFDNPVYDYGLRNPYRFSFDRKTGDLIIGDVGQDLHEEIDFRAAGSAAGANFGWSCREGKSVYTDSTPDPSCSATTKPSELRRAGARLPALGRRLLDHRRLRRPRPDAHHAQRPLRLRRPVHEQAAQRGPRQPVG